MFVAKEDLNNKSMFYWDTSISNGNDGNSSQNEIAPKKPKKVIMMLVDALREDFVQFPDDSSDIK